MTRPLDRLVLGAVFPVLVVLMGAVFAFACGDDASEPAPLPQAEQSRTAAPEQLRTDAPEQSPTATPEQSPSEIIPLKIAFLADFSGPLAEFGPAIHTGVALAIRHVNDAGGVLGRDVTLVTGDTQVSPTVGVEEARRLVDVAGVHAIVGPLTSSVTIAVAESVSGPAGIPTISPSATSPSVTLANDAGFLFRSTISDAAQAPILAQLVSALGVDNVAVLYLNDAYGQGLADRFDASFAGSATLVSLEDGQLSYLAELRQAASGGAEYLVAISFPAQAKVYIREALEHDLFERFVFVDGTKSEELIAEIGAELLEGSPGTAPASPETEAFQAWDRAYVDAYGGLPSRPFVREAYDATIALAFAAEAAGSLEGAAIRDALVRVASPPGLLVLPGADGVRAGLENIRAGGRVNYEGAATALDWNAAGDVANGFVGIWAFIGGHIVEQAVVPVSLE